MKYTLDDFIKYRLKRADESIEEAKLLAHEGYWNTVANRLYYAAFYAINALLVKHNIKANSHSGMKSVFHKNFIKSGIIDLKFGKHYSNLFDKRQEGDYQVFKKFSSEEIEPLIKITEKFIREIKKVISDLI